MWQEIIELFTQMGWVSGILLTLGIVFAIVEFFTPGLGFSGAVSGLCIIGGIIARMVEGASFTQLCIMILIVLILFTVLFLLTIRSAKYGVLSKSPFVETGTAVSTDMCDAKLNPLNALIGKIGITKSFLRPIGTIQIDEQKYSALASIGYIKSDIEVEVVGVEGKDLVVKSLEKKE